MLEDYIAAGLDPARFWDLTPRLYMIEMRGADRRARIERAYVWWGAMLPHLKKPMSLQDFVDPPRVERIQTPVQMQAMCDALAASWGAERISDGN